MIKAGIMGATGYTGAELVRLLELHPEIETIFLDSRSYEGVRFDAIYPNLRSKVEDICRSINVDDVPEDTDIIFSALPHRVSQSKVLPLIKRGFRVIDFSADFRLREATIYEHWYETKHLDDRTLKKAVYGLPEWYADSIANAALVANPGCFPTSILLPLLPLLKEKRLHNKEIIIDSKTGVSGAGRSSSEVNIFSQVNENIKAYNIGKHRHTPEIEQELSLAAGSSVNILFTPHLIPIDRGILSTIVISAEGITRKDVETCYEAYYEKAPFIRILKEGYLPETKAVKGSNFCDIGFVIDSRSGKLVVVSAIDNLLKGSSSQAVQNMNVMFGLDERTGLDTAPIWP
ncbi:N-acetyl-gamma-glutamyl-phosphate reductase [Tindallia californiensis]|uniref:N-acetyl-gamma-glutamyl-phosphate reductase n=1 Tax=Tindallia californiensis TaxID=159292 RepID=A0A1H3II67_9FIRM|nr:N-acetyl-gamma-glutamyl-phosphate reductase [Tindallia californiensis]SDY26768.1 N-acetyl-gamma-glutamyl-phosphate reductase [Tindallia californiensis]